MRRDEFENLAVGDYCTIVRGRDAGKIVEVVYIEDGIDCANAIVVKPVGHELFTSPTVYGRYLRVTTSYELKLYK